MGSESAGLYTLVPAMLGVGVVFCCRGREVLQGIMQYGSRAFAARPGEVWGNRDKA